jgi:hypothetical protein
MPFILRFAHGELGLGRTEAFGDGVFAIVVTLLGLRRWLHAAPGCTPTVVIRSGMKKFLLNSLIAGAALAGMAGCAQIKKPATQVRAVPAGLRFDQVGSVSLFPGEPCTPQIMFNFRGAGSTVRLAAPKHETKTLSEAAKNYRRVHISGKWRRGGQSNCSYVEVTSAEVTR